MRLRIGLLVGALFAALQGCGSEQPGASGSIELVNVSYDPTRELYRDMNQAFSSNWSSRTGQGVRFRMSHGGSGKQARAVIDGLDADVVTLALAHDVDVIAERTRKLPVDWQTRLPNNSSPYTSTIVFLVRAGNPKGVRDWPDLVKPGITVITPNPKTSGGARWNFLAAWGYGRKVDGTERGAEQFVRQLFANVPVLDSGARGSTTTFVERGIGDVLLAWENEALLAQEKLGPGKFEIVVPSVSVLAEPPVAVIENNAYSRGTLDVAKAYLDYLYTPAAQEIIARNFYRPRDAAVAAKYAARFPSLDLLTIDRDFGGWKAAQERFFDDGSIFDRIVAERRR